MPKLIAFPYFEAKLAAWKKRRNRPPRTFKDGQLVWCSPNDHFFIATVEKAILMREHKTGDGWLYQVEPRDGSTGWCLSSTSMEAA